MTYDHMPILHCKWPLLENSVCTSVWKLMVWGYHRWMACALPCNEAYFGNQCVFFTMDHPFDSVHVLKHVAQIPKEGEYILWACTWRPACLEEYHIELKITCGHRSSSNTMWSSNTMLFWDNKRLRFRHCLLHTGTMSEAEVFSSWYMQNVEPLWAHDLHDYCWTLRWRVIVCPSPSSPKMIW